MSDPLDIIGLGWGTGAPMLGGPGGSELHPGGGAAGAGSTWRSSRQKGQFKQLVGLEPLLKICPICRRTWSGGRDCPHCGEGHPLIDVAGKQGRRTFLRDKELASAIRGYYGARTGMLIAFWGILLGLILALFLWRKSIATHSPGLLAAAIACAVLPFLVSIVAADRVVRRFSRGCVGRPPGPMDIRVAPKSDAREDLLGFGQRG